MYREYASVDNKIIAIDNNRVDVFSNQDEAIKYIHAKNKLEISKQNLANLEVNPEDYFNEKSEKAKLILNIVSAIFAITFVASFVSIFITSIPALISNISAILSGISLLSIPVIGIYSMVQRRKEKKNIKNEIKAIKELNKELEKECNEALEKAKKNEHIKTEYIDQYKYPKELKKRKEELMKLKQELQNITSTEMETEQVLEEKPKQRIKHLNN